MVVDTSALLAILLAEPEAEALVRALAAAEHAVIGAPTLVGASAVMRARKGPGERSPWTPSWSAWESRCSRSPWTRPGWPVWDTAASGRGWGIRRC